jgi:transcriptional regulator with XRE-family HTH domain
MRQSLQPIRSEVLQSARRVAGLSQLELASRLGCSLATLRIAERGLASEPFAQRLAAALNVPARMLLAGEEG